MLPVLTLMALNGLTACPLGVIQNISLNTLQRVLFLHCHMCQPQVIIHGQQPLLHNASHLKVVRRQLFIELPEQVAELQPPPTKETIQEAITTPVEEATTEGDQTVALATVTTKGDQTVTPTAAQQPANEPEATQPSKKSKHG